MKRFSVALVLVVWTICALAIERSQTIVYINGAKYYVHTVQHGETIRGLAQAYGVTEQAIVASNAAIARGGLKVSENIKIPYVAPAEPAAVPSERKLRKTFDQHTVAKGETFYAIARRYEIPVSTLMEDNPEVDPAHLRAGETLLIRKTGIGTGDTAGARAEWEEYRDQLNSVSDESILYYIVQSGDTYYSLSRRFEVPEQRLREMNGPDLKVGAMLRVPAKRTEPAIVAEQPDVARNTPADREVPQILFRPLWKYQPLQVALLLPVEMQGEVNPNYMDFYQGFLMGLDSVRLAYGRSVDVALYNTKRDAERVRAILEMPAFARTQLIVGPVYEEAGLREVVEFAEQREIPVVSPLANITSMKSDVLFQMAPDPVGKYDKVSELFQPDKRITLIYSESTDREFEQEMLTRLGGMPYARFDYKYDHETAREEGSTSDLTPILENEEDNVLIILSDNEIDVDRILAGIASADTNLRARSVATPRFLVLGNARWNRYNNIDRTMFFKNHVVFLSTYHAKRDARIVRDFDSAYIRAFGTIPSLYAYRGYDTAMIFCPAMYSDIEYDMEGRRYVPLQTVYRFEQPDPNGNHLNRNWMRVDYNPDYTITLQ